MLRRAVTANLAAMALLCALAGLIAAPPAPAVVGQPPDIGAGSYILVNPATGETLAARSSEQPLSMASTTKIMTALIALERADLDDRFTVPERAALIGGSSAYLQAGESISVRDLITGLLVASGNDAAVTLAEGVAGSEEAFVALMNEKAAELGLTQTRFANPHGLDEDGHHASVRDLVTLAQVAMRNPVFRETVRHYTAEIPGPGGVGVRTLTSQNLLLERYAEADGVKTGMTDEAGYAVVAHARRKSLGVELYAAIIGSSSSEARAAEAEALLRWGFEQYARPTILRRGEVVGRVAVQYRPGVSVPYRVDRAVRPAIRLGEPVVEEIAAPAEVAGPVREGDVLGTITIRQNDDVLVRRDLVAAGSADSAGLFDRVNAGLRALIP